MLKAHWTHRVAVPCVHAPAGRKDKLETLRGPLVVQDDLILLELVFSPQQPLQPVLLRATGCAFPFIIILYCAAWLRPPWDRARMRREKKKKKKKTNKPAPSCIRSETFTPTISKRSRTPSPRFRFFRFSSVLRRYSRGGQSLTDNV